MTETTREATSFTEFAEMLDATDGTDARIGDRRRHAA